MKRIFKLAIIVSLIAISLIAGTLLSGLARQKEENSLYTYTISTGDKNSIVTLETNWNLEPEPKVTLIDDVDESQALEFIFRQGVEKTVTYNITFSIDLLEGNISLIRKYYTQDPDRYTLTNNSTHTSLSMTFDYNPYFSGNGYFVILGTKGD